MSGPLAGKTLELVPADELTFALWKKEQPNGTVVADAKGFEGDYAKKDWDTRMAKVPVVLSYAERGMKPRDLVLGMHLDGESKAYPFDLVMRQKVVQDNVGSVPVLLVVGPDGKSVRAFRQDAETQFYWTGGPTVMDSDGHHWNFQGWDVDAKGRCLDEVYVFKDYWFDWRNYNPSTAIYKPR